MADLETYACVEIAGYGESFDPSVLRTEMERGVPKQRVINSHVMQELPCNLLFDSAQDVADFEEWYLTTIKRIGSFTFEHPRAGVTLTGRFKGGDIGTLAPVNNRRERWRRSVTIEYLR